MVYMVPLFCMKCNKQAEPKEKTKELFCMKKRGRYNDYPDMTSTASITETTGLMPTPPLNGEEKEAYEELAGMEIPKKDHI